MRSSEAVKAIKERLNIADIIRRYVDLKPVGSRLAAPCPFHSETKPSFYVDSEKGFFHCFGCQASGDIFEFYSRINGLDFKESLERLAEEAGIVIDQAADSARIRRNKKEAGEKRLMLEMHEAAARHFALSLGKSGGEECRAYMEARGVSPDIREKFLLGWAGRGWHELHYYLKKEGYSEELAAQCGLLAVSSSGGAYDRFRGRLMFPIKSLSNQIIAFGGRIIGGEEEAKYINSQETPLYKKKEQLYGLAQARRGIASKGRLILTEGYMDVLTLHQFGYDNSAGALGTALTEEQIQRAAGFTSNFLLLFDGDKAGRKAALRASGMILSRGLACDVVLLPEEEDIDSLLRKYGREAFEEMAAKALPGLDFCADSINRLAPKEALDWARGFLGSVKMPELFGRFAKQLAHKLGVEERYLRNEAGAARPAIKSAPDGGALEMARLQNTRDRQIMIFAARYPERLADLKALGADLCLSSPEAREFWELLEKWGADEISSYLSESQRNFWHCQRTPPAPPLDSGDRELECLKLELSSYHKAGQLASLSAALAASRDNFQEDLEYLRALQKTLENNNEQS